jgi:hypothetical protein
VREVTEMVGHNNQVTVRMIAEALIINTERVRLILFKGLIMKKVCVTTIVKDLNGKQEKING